MRQGHPPLEALPTAKQVELKNRENTAAALVEEWGKLPRLLLVPDLRVEVLRGLS